MSVDRSPRTPAALAGSTPCALLGVLAFPWAVHALVVLLSEVGLHPLSGRGLPAAILATAAVFSVTLGVRANARTRAGGGARADVGADYGQIVATLSWLLVAAAALGLLVALAAAVLLPVVAYDAIGYRLPTIASWLDRGRIAWVDTDDPVRNGYPLGQEAISAVVAAATGTLRFAGATSLILVAAGALAIPWAAASLGVRRSLARAAGALFALCPMVILNAPSGYVDAAFAGALVTLISTATVLRTAGDRDLSLAVTAVTAITTGMAAALVLALKGNGLGFVAIVAIALASSPTLRKRAQGRRALGLAAVIALPGAFWALRDVVHTGNPLWPVRIALGGHVLLPGVASMADILDVSHNTPGALDAFPGPLRTLITWLEPTGPARDFDDRAGGLGYAWPFAAVPAIGVATFRAVRRGASPFERRLGGLLLVTAACFVLQPLKWWSRYTLWLWGAGALSLAVLGERLAQSERRALLSGGLALISALSMAEGAYAAARANGAWMALSRPSTPPGGLADPKRGANARKWIAASFWQLGLQTRPDVCRGSYKPGSDDANLDGVFAQLSPRPRVHVVPDDDGDWVRVKRAWKGAACRELLLLRGSPVLPLAARDPEVSVEAAVAFDPLFVVRPRTEPLAGSVVNKRP
jgi:hypothetical protein